MMNPTYILCCFFVNLSTQDPRVVQGAFMGCENPGNHIDEGGVAELEEILKQKTFTRQDDLKLHLIDIKLKCMVNCATLF